MQCKSWTTTLLSFYNAWYKCGWINPTCPVTTSFNEVIYFSQKPMPERSILLPPHLPPQQASPDRNYNAFILLKPPKVLKWRRLLSLHPAVAKQQISADPNWSQVGEMVTRHMLQHTWDLCRFWQGKEGFDWRGIKAWKVQQGPSELSWSMVAAAAFTVRDTTLQQNLTGQNYKIWLHK